jgi:AcrR family transcriptional regulator
VARTRRIGAEDSATRTAILDATEKLILDEGYAAVSTRRVGKQIGLTAALVHYYFPTTDDLFVAVFRRAAEKTSALFQEALESEQPLHALWRFTIELPYTALAMEFMALANHRKAVRSEIARHGDNLRRIQSQALSKLPFGKEAGSASPLGLTVVLVGIARLLVMETSLGISLGHDEAQEIVSDWITQLEKLPSQTPVVVEPV